MERAVWAKAERDATKHEEAMARLEIEAMSGARVEVEAELSHIRRASAAVEDSWMKAESEGDAVQQVLAAAEEENGRLTDERLSLLLELGATKDEFGAFQEKASAEKMAMEVEFDASSDVIFNYGYGCYAFAHNICGS